MILYELLKVINNDYKVLCNGKEIKKKKNFAKRNLFKPSNNLQRAIGRVAVVADCAHALGAFWHGKMAGEIADFFSFSFHAVNVLETEVMKWDCKEWTKNGGLKK